MRARVGLSQRLTGAGLFALLEPMVGCRYALAALTILVSCGGESRAEDERPRTAAVRPVDEPAPEPTPVAAEEPPEEPEPDLPSFDDPLPTAPCPDEVAVRLAHRERDLPGLLAHAVALRSEDGRHLRIALSDAPLERDESGRFLGPASGGARFEMEATRARRGPLEPRVLGPPDARRGALSHVRVITDGARLTFGHRDIGQVELTAIEDTEICGRIELDDGFTRIRGAFRAPIVGPLPP